MKKGGAGGEIRTLIFLPAARSLPIELRPRPSKEPHTVLLLEDGPAEGEGCSARSLFASGQHISTLPAFVERLADACSRFALGLSGHGAVPRQGLVKGENGGPIHLPCRCWPVSRGATSGNRHPTEVGSGGWIRTSDTRIWKARYSQIGAHDPSRTGDLPITNRMLCRLSYVRAVYRLAGALSSRRTIGKRWNGEAGEACVLLGQATEAHHHSFGER